MVYLLWGNRIHGFEASNIYMAKTLYMVFNTFICTIIMLNLLETPNTALFKDLVRKIIDFKVAENGFFCNFRVILNSIIFRLISLNRVILHNSDRLNIIAQMYNLTYNVVCMVSLKISEYQIFCFLFIIDSITIIHVNLAGVRVLKKKKKHIHQGITAHFQLDPLTFMSHSLVPKITYKVPKDHVFNTQCKLCFFNFFSMVAPGTIYRRNFLKIIFGSKIGNL